MREWAAKRSSVPMFFLKFSAITYPASTENIAARLRFVLNVPSALYIWVERPKLWKNPGVADWNFWPLKPASTLEFLIYSSAGKNYGRKNNHPKPTFAGSWRSTTKRAPPDLENFNHDVLGIMPQNDTKIVSFYRDNQSNFFKRKNRWVIFWKTLFFFEKKALKMANLQQEAYQLVYKSSKNLLVKFFDEKLEKF